MLDEIQRFLTDVWEAGGRAEPDRILATVLFSDIVGSSEKAAELGDGAWRELLERHHELVRRQLARFRGAEVDTAGDGFFASFDGPARAIRCAAPSPTRSASLGFRCASVSIPASARCSRARSPDRGAYRRADRGESTPGEVLVSGTVKDLVAGSGLAFQDRGGHELKGIPGEWRLYNVER